MVCYNINTRARISMFLAQVMHESGELKYVVENLNYSSDGLMKVFPYYFPNKHTADVYARQPEKIANRIYANRMGNGSEESGDGWKFRGQGLIQITGKNNYRLLSDDLGLDFIARPELLQLPEYATLSAGWFWNKHSLNNLADLDNEQAFKTLTRVINGGENGYSNRFTYWVAYKSAIK